MKDSYKTRLELAEALVEKHGLPEGVTLTGLDQYGRMEFDVDLNKKQMIVAEMSEVVAKCNFVDRLMYSYDHLIEKAA